ncbi:hypothetical protein HMPREF9004_1239 [Schaalia cardiffensis F0333]|uniref:Uncharacterized protein n=1 Tax=Schaalia cardiffensis F0333 TaxID=888050 RepID=N6X3E4_9ACTO|nr:hypothetical protein HMPREF9004_1239 [Schaalia cardiffensis F0333]
MSSVLLKSFSRAPLRRVLEAFLSASEALSSASHTSRLDDRINGC